MPAGLTREIVLQVMEEYDRLGEDAFLSKYYHKPATTYTVRHRGRSYPSKAICGVAMGCIPGSGHPKENFDGKLFGGKQGAALWLTKLGFTVDGM
ncbi:hypothetical protein HZA57_04080 [Candidatus Poribacteria bacterium]|nr:hypothetical protein [Candidatus Poribacteria bacterium]